MDKGATVLDDLTIHQGVVELKYEKYYEKYGKYEVIKELINEVKNKKENFNLYYDEIKKYALLRNFKDLFGDKVLEINGKYDYHKMNTNQIKIWWANLFNESLINVDAPIIEYNLLEDLDEFINDLDQNTDIGMPFYNSKKLTDVTNGMTLGTISILTGFSGAGKSSFAVEKIVMSCIIHNEKLLIIGNEMSVKAYRKLLLITVMGGELYDKLEKQFNRKKIHKGNFTESEKEKLKQASQWVREITKGNNALIKFVPINDYTRSNLEKIIRYYAHRNYVRLLLDTAKPSDESGKDRWRTFVEDFDMLYNLGKPDNLNLGIITTCQAADELLKMRFLNELCIADGKKIKNVGDLTLHLRAAWDSEYEGGSDEVEVIKYIPTPFGENDYGKEIIKLRRDRIYYFLFVSKNRFGETNSTGLDVLVYSVNFNTNRWSEVGWTKSISRNFN